MISQAHRFHGRNSLRFVYHRGQNIRSEAISLRFAINPRRKNYRIAVVVSRKVSKSAVVRNRIRRRIYEISRVSAAKLDMPLDFIFTVYGDQVAEWPHETLMTLIAADMEKAVILARSTTPRHVIVGAKEKDS